MIIRPTLTVVDPKIHLGDFNCHVPFKFDPERTGLTAMQFIVRHLNAGEKTCWRMAVALGGGQEMIAGAGYYYAIVTIMITMMIMIAGATDHVLDPHPWR